MSILVRGGLAALLLAASGCASGSAGRSGSSLERRADDLEARNQQLREELRRKEAEVEQSFASATSAENAAQLGGLGCAAVMSVASPVKGQPRSGSIHSQVALRNQRYRMTASFSPARTAGGWKVSQGNCQVATP